MKRRYYFDPVEHAKKRKRGQVAGGLMLILFGGLWMAQSAGSDLPEWLISWPVILIGIGIIQLIKHQFRHLSGYILLLIGGGFLAKKIDPELSLHYFFWPGLLILIGLTMILKPLFSRGKKSWEEEWSEEKGLSNDASTLDRIQVESIFGGVEKNIITKNFSGGRITCVFGGAEINMMQADIQKPAELEIHTVFGGVELALPSDWKVVSDLTNVMGGVEDKRPINPAQADSNKVLRLTGACVFGGVEIKGF